MRMLLVKQFHTFHSIRLDQKLFVHAEILLYQLTQIARHSRIRSQAFFPPAQCQTIIALLLVALFLTMMALFPVARYSTVMTLRLNSENPTKLALYLTRNVFANGPKWDCQV